jgi:ribosomal-protein-alanine N-acetyltransferase
VAEGDVGAGRRAAEPALRALGPDDVPRWAALQAETLPDPYTEAALRHELDIALTRAYGLFVDDELVAAVLAWLVVDELQIMTVVVDPRRRRRGYGARVVGHLLRRARAAGARTATLEVRAGNEAAIALYERLGFSPDGLRRSYYPDGEDALLMRCELRPAHAEDKP